MLAKPLALALGTLLCAAPPALTQAGGDPASPGAGRVLRTTRASGEIEVDGRLDEPAWRSAEVTSDFTQSYPNPGAAPTERTEARVLYTDAAIYVVVRMYDARPDSIAAQLARRDASGIYSDWLHVVIDSYHDRRTAFRFSVNPRGIQKDVFHFNDTGEDADWDAVWKSGTQVDSLGWTAELRIPVSQLRFSGAEPPGGRAWGLQIQRDIARREERDSWSPWTRTDAGYVSRFGDLAGLVGLQPVRRAELLPYVSNRLDRVPGDSDDPFHSPNRMALSAGADVKVGLTSGLTFSGTINPDFGQVEVDPAVVNLSAFETFFPEKRPFFVEGADIFRFGQVRTFNNYNFEEYFYSRRIGRAPQRDLSADTVAFLDAPEQSTILGAAKVSGKVGPWTLGVMDAVTAEETARLAVNGGARRTAPVEPLTNYFVGRLRRDLRSGATVLGAMLNATHRDMAGGAFEPLLRDRSLFAGVDGEHSWSNRRWTISGYLAGSVVHGSREAIELTQSSSARYFQRPDADHVELDPTRTSLAGHMGELALRRSGDWDLSLGYKETSPYFEINDLGFQNRTDFRALSTFLGRRVERPGRLLRSHSYFGYSYHVWNFGGNSILQGVGTGANATFHNLWSVGVNAGFRPWTTDDRLTRGGPLARQPRTTELSAFVESDRRKTLSYAAELSSDWRAEGGWSRSVGVSADYRPSSAARIRLSPRLSREFGTAQFVQAVDDAFAASTFGRRYVFADIHQTTVSMETRLDWTFSPNLSLQLFAQPFVAVGDYHDFKEFLRPGSYDFALYGRERGTLTRGAGCAEPGTPGVEYLVDPDGAGPAACFSFREQDFNVRSLRGNAVLRWEYRPGSVLFFVWQQQRDGFEEIGTFDLGSDAGELFRAPARNVFLVKATYWLGR